MSQIKGDNSKRVKNITKYLKIFSITRPISSKLGTHHPQKKMQWVFFPTVKTQRR
jgi:hypothetical protein